MVRFKAWRLGPTVSFWKGSLRSSESGGEERDELPADDGGSDHSYASTSDFDTGPRRCRPFGKGEKENKASAERRPDIVLEKPKD